MHKGVKFFLAIMFTASISFGQVKDDHTQTHQGIHKILLKDVLQTRNYTYLLGEEGGKLQWMAVPKIEATVGEYYYYKGGMEMVNFKSTELDRTFASVMFLNGVISQDEFNKQQSENDVVVPPGAAEAAVEKTEVDVSPVEGSITIKELFSKPVEYSGKIVRIKGEVTKFSSAIMSRNWIHLQDGTEFEGLYDLVATSEEEVKVGSIIVLEGVIATDKDFGYGYFYKVIMEEAKVIAK